MRRSAWLLVMPIMLASCQSAPDPVPCEPWEQHVEHYAQKYHLCLEDTGNLRQQLKACQKKR